MAKLSEVVDYLDTELRSAEVPDYSGALNGLQLANAGSVTHVAAAVDFSTRTATEAAKRNADFLLVHHGMFWGGAAPFVGTSFDRISALVRAGVAVYSSHIPLDLHPRHGNNVLLARELGLEPSGGFAMMRGVAIGVSGTSDLPTRLIVDRAQKLAGRHGGSVISTPVTADRLTKRWGICSGAGASPETLNEALIAGIDTLIVGEGPHHTAVQAIDLGITVVYAGHYATETFGVISIGEEIARRFSVQFSFIEAPTGL
jgi:dinuclear metal center YbgI/SA1388 family protein